MSLIEEAKKGLVLDGAMSDELERQGVDTNNKLWTGIALIDDLDKVYQAHMDYFQAGAQLVITDTYQANSQAFVEAGYSLQEAKKFIADGVKIAKQARDDYENRTGQHNYVAATIGSYGAYLADGSEYRGDYELSRDEYLAFHLPRLKTVLSQDPDILAIETQPKLSETIVLLDWVKKNAKNIPVYVSFTLKNSKQISDGTSLKEAIKKINEYQQVFAVGINCVNPDLVDEALIEMNKYTDKSLVVYPNSGTVYDPKVKQWKKVEKQYEFSQLAARWYQLGARLIGGCCTTGPEEIKRISQTLTKLR
ncbi:homocysteine S-methyltransferase [Lactobacillus colini]|uniref:Homocysteine S-methyltransferase n=1 Tax=Lactobacillus colini TaxID=1819254 RepID=A0ABS4MDU6_9LACO|nr:homocysteine S-methyltransferase [Lactobacillus colini]MBP2057864.1 homocysteine S-methyltransferase [Lactobacillus colini]